MKKSSQIKKASSIQSQRNRSHRTNIRSMEVDILCLPLKDEWKDGILSGPIALKDLIYLKRHTITAHALTLGMAPPGLLANNHIFTEFTHVNGEPLDELIELADKNQLFIQVGHIERFNSAFLSLKENSERLRLSRSIVNFLLSSRKLLY